MIVSDIGFYDLPLMVVYIGSLFSFLGIFKNSIGYYFMYSSFNKVLIQIYKDKIGDKSASQKEMLNFVKNNLTYEKTFETIMEVDKMSQKLN